MSVSLLSFALSAPSESKFKKHSAKITEMLERCLKLEKTPLYVHQIQAVMNTKRLTLSDEADRLNHLMGDGQDAKVKPVVIVAPTGSGKSGMIVLLPYVLASQKVLVLTPSKVITEQLRIAFGDDVKRPSFFEVVGLGSGDPVERKAELENLLEDVRVIEGPQDLLKRTGNLYIVNAQKFGGKARLSMSLEYRNKDIIPDVESFFKKFDTLIVDEAHHFPAKTWENIVKEFSKPSDGMVKKIIFVTATPYKIINGREQFILGSEDDAEARIAYKITADAIRSFETRRECEFREPEHPGSNENLLLDIIDIIKENRELEPRLRQSKVMILVSRKTTANDLVDYMNWKMKRQDFAIAVLGDKPDALDKFTYENYRVAVTCGVGKEGYDNANVIACVILRNIVKGRILFNQFIGRCTRKHRGLGGSGPDRTVGIVLSYKKHALKTLWENRDKLAEEDPVEVDDDVDESNGGGAKKRGNASVCRAKNCNNCKKRRN